MGDVKDVDPAAKRVILADGAVFPYDYLIVGAGSQTSYYGHDEWQEWAPGLKSIAEATNIRHKILYAFEAAERIDDEPELHREWLTFVIVGAGATGVELAGAIAEIARQTLKDDFRSIHPEEARIVLIDGGPRLLGSFPEVLSKKAERGLAKRGVQVRTGVMVKQVDRTYHRERLLAGAAAVSHRDLGWRHHGIALGHILAERTGAKTDRGGRIEVGPYLATCSRRSSYFQTGSFTPCTSADIPAMPQPFCPAMRGRLMWSGVTLTYLFAGAVLAAKLLSVRTHEQSLEAM
jgi:NADH dehydrogenase